MSERFSFINAVSYTAIMLNESLSMQGKIAEITSVHTDVNFSMKNNIALSYNVAFHAGVFCTVGEPMDM